MSGQVTDLQRNLQRLGLYLGELDGQPGPLTCDAMVHALVSRAPPLTGVALSKAIPSEWWEVPPRVNMLLAMIHAETAFMLTVENLNYDVAGLVRTWPTRFQPLGLADPALYAHNPQAIANLVYGGRMGNIVPNDGWNFRGRGWPQLTGRTEYQQFGYVTLPDALTDIDASARVAVAVLSSHPQGLAAADAGNVTVCRIDWNGGTNGLQVASDSFDKLQILWGIP